MRFWDRVVFVLRFWPSELPSRKKDSELVLVLHSIPYGAIGIVALALASVASPALRQLPAIWLATLTSLTSFYQKCLCSLLSLVSLWFAAFAIGVLIVEKLRRYYRQYIVRPFERRVGTQS
jgi:hypothetical protein